MQIGGLAGPFAGSGVHVSITPPRVPFGGLEPAGGSAKAGFEQLAKALLRLREGLALADRSATVRRGASVARPFAAIAVARSAAPLGLDTSETPTTLASSDEINAIPTSFSPFESGFGGLSATRGELFGAYDGSQGDGALTFRIRQSGIVGTTQVQIEVRDAQSVVIDTLTFSAGYVPGTPLALSNGLQLALSSGSAVAGESFEAQVSATVGSVVRADERFDGTGDERPNFEPGLGVVTGSFTINGASIAVEKSDTILSVLGKINASGAGVNASFDAASERIRLVQATPGSEPSITFGPDSSGFLAATKLAGATPSPGGDGQHRAPLAQVAAFAGIAAGTFRVGATELAVDPSQDSLLDVLARIEGAGEGLSARYLAASDRVQIQASSAGTTFALDDGTSGLFSALGIAPGTYGSEAEAAEPGGAPQLRLEGYGGLRRGLALLIDGLEQLFGAPFAGLAKGSSAVVAQKLEGAVRAAFADFGRSSSGALRSGIGIDFDFDAPDGRVLAVDDWLLRGAAQRRPETLARLLLGPELDGRRGLFARLERALDEAGAYLADGAPGGLLLDLSA